MIEIIFFLLFSETCNINIVATIGAKFYHLQTNNNDNVCFTITSYPFFIIFNEFDNSVIYKQYSSSSIDTEYEKTEESLLRFLPVYKMMSSPFEFVVLETPVASNLSFTIASLPGMCLNGLYLSNRESDTVIFSKFYDENSEKKFFKLNEYDDKCLIYSSPFMKQHVKVQMTSSNLTNQVFLYSQFHNYFSIYGNSSIEQTSGQSPIIVNNNNIVNTDSFKDNNIHLSPENNFNTIDKINSVIKSDFDLNKATILGSNNDIQPNRKTENNFDSIDYLDNDNEAPFVIRIISDGKNPPNYVNVTFNVVKDNETNNDPNNNNKLLQVDWNEGRSGLYLPPQKIERCKEKKTWHSKKIAIIVIVLLFVLFLALVYIITSNSLNNLNDTQIKLVKTNNNNNNEPNQFESLDTSSHSSFYNPSVLKTLVS